MYTYIDCGRIIREYKEHDEWYDGDHDDENAREEATVCMWAVHGEVVKSGTAAVWRTHTQHAGWKVEFNVSSA